MIAEWAHELEEAFDERRHPRDRLGRFDDVLGRLTTGKGSKGGGQWEAPRANKSPDVPRNRHASYPEQSHAQAAAMRREISRLGVPFREEKREGGARRLEWRIGTRTLVRDVAQSGAVSDPNRKPRHPEQRDSIFKPGEDPYEHARASQDAALRIADEKRAARGGGPDMSSIDLKGAPLSGLAEWIQSDWAKVNFAARPYLDAMMGLNSVNDQYGMDSGRSVVSYFLSNASSWKGPTAKIVKAELRRRLKEGGEPRLATLTLKIEEQHERRAEAHERGDAAEFAAADERMNSLIEAVLTGKARKSLPKSAFAIPPDRYPIHDRAHGANALARASGKPEEGRVKAAVCRRYSDLPACKKKG